MQIIFDDNPLSKFKGLSSMYYEQFSTLRSHRDETIEQFIHRALTRCSGNIIEFNCNDVCFVNDNESNEEFLNRCKLCLNKR